MITFFLLIYLMDGPQKLDIIYFNNGDTLNVEMIEVSSSEIKYKYTGESLIVTQPLNYLIDKVLLKSGREIQSTKRMQKEYYKGYWQYIIITREPSDVEGLKIVGRGKGISSFGGRMKKRAQKGAENSIRKKAAQKGAFIVLLTDEYEGVTGVTRNEGVYYALPEPGTYKN